MPWDISAGMSYVPPGPNVHSISASLKTPEVVVAVALAGSTTAAAGATLERRARRERLKCVTRSSPADPIQRRRHRDTRPQHRGTRLEAVNDGSAVDRAAFTELVRRHDDRLRGLAYKLLGGDRDLMDDALQEAYVRAYRALPAFRGDADVSTWLYRIVYNACVDELRRSRRQGEPVDTSAPGGAETSSPSPGPDRVVVARDATTRALAQLPDVQRVIVVLVDGEGFDPRTVAGILDVAPGTVRSRLFRARAAIRRALGEEDLDE
jgi:RNA polymerase sigma-70 factor, ECF subfamily